MSTARLPRFAPTNPGRRHLPGADITAKQQRQYERILSSLRVNHKYTSDAKRKQVAAATVRALRQNPGELERAEQLAEAFHGRPPRETIEVLETEHYDEYGSILGYLEELWITLDEDDEFGHAIQFPYSDARGESENGPDNRDTVLAVSNPKGTNIEFIGGDQDINWRAVEGSSAAEDKYLVMVGPVLKIAYFTDKHHLEGPISQAQGTPYEHEFGEEGGELPYLIFDRRNTKLLLVGGSYTIEPEGIRN